MTEKPTFDPIASWQQVVSRWEREVNDWSGKITESDEFSGMMGQATKMSLLAQNSFNEQMEKLLVSMNLSSRAQIEALAERLDHIDENIEKLTLALQQRSGPSPRRTRKPPADGE